MADLPSFSGTPDRVRPFLSKHPSLLRFVSRLRTLQYTGYHYADAVVPRQHVIAALRGYPRFFRDRNMYQRMTGERLSRYDDNPQLRDWTESTPFDPHYAYQDAWAAQEIFGRRPRHHVDVGSRISFVLGLTAFVSVTFVDLRPLQIELPGLTSRCGSILELPYEDEALESLSCLHVAEHIGLGRYGDPLDPAGTLKAARELQRVLAPGGFLYFSIPVGRQRTAFNAHRVLNPVHVEELFEELRLDGFAGVDDRGAFHTDLRPGDLAGADWACGFYRLTRA